MANAYTEWQMNETPTQSVYWGAVCSNVYSYSIPRIREADQAPGREGGFYPSTIFFFCCSDEKGYFPIRPQAAPEKEGNRKGILVVRN